MFRTDAQPYYRSGNQSTPTTSGSNLSRYNPFPYIGDKFKQVGDTGSSLLRNPSNPNAFTISKVDISQGFLNQNSLVSKFAFLILVLLMFLIFLRIGITILSYYFKPTQSPKLIDGMINAKQLMVIPQNPKESNAKTIYRSVNEQEGVEFTWSVWIYINDLTYQENMYRHIFHKGNNDLVADASNKLFGTNSPNNAPGLYIKPNTNTLVVMMNTFDVINKEVEIPNIPINKWVNVIIRCHTTTLDVYVNGTLARSIELSGVPKQNYGNVFVAMNGGFDGYISNLWYYNYSLGTAAIQRLVAKGPNTKIAGNDGINIKNSKYLSMRWFFDGQGNSYNPAVIDSVAPK
jgi:hypothetical protein